MRKKLALVVGINNYPGTGNDLNGCVNDAVAWEALLTNNGYEVTTLLDDDATRLNVISEIGAAMADLRFGDRFVFTYSGHGSWVPDKDGDESDMRDECIVLHDWQAQGFVTDDELYALYQTRKYGVRVTAISDSCYSGTVARLMQQSAQPPGSERKVKFFDPGLLTEGVKAEPRRVRDVRSRPGTVLLSGCSDVEVSYDAYIDGQPQGAFSNAALKSWSPKLNMKQWHREILKTLDYARYPQTPQLQASTWQRLWKL